jgi:glycosyltransferase involved in cell wall biosynthesis
MDTLVRAVGDLPEAARPIVMVAGEGPERAALARLAERLGVDLRLPGHIPAAELSEWMAAAAVYVQPSRVLPSGRCEGMPLAAREALARGLPLIATASGGLVELQGLPGVTLIAPNDSCALSAVLAARLAKVA